MKFNVLFISLLFCGSLGAQNLKIVGTITEDITLTSPSLSKANPSQSITKNKKIKLLKVELSQKSKQNITKKVMKLQQTTPSAVNNCNNKIPTRINLGMNEVPVLDQGLHGTCVTFAVTAAIDAALDKGDYISQLCQLQLGNYLENNGYTTSGWDGSFGPIVLSQISTFGFINKQNQLNNGCGNLTDYPINDQEAPSSEITLEEFHQLSEPLSEDSDEMEEPTFSWSNLLDINQAFSDRIDTNKTLDEVKATLNRGDRLTFGVLLWDVDMGVAGAIGQNKAVNDSWILTPEIARDTYLRPVSGGHEMIITGYDDNAVAIDEQGRKYKGLLTLRNSWGSDVGNQGDFYMSYEYFKLFVIEVIRIRNSNREDALHFKHRVARSKP